MKEETIIFSESEITQVTDRLQDIMAHCSIFTFDGPLGAGKTTVIRELLKKCGVRELVTSPTFTYLNMYENNQGQLFYHFDLYRLENLEEFLAAGFNEYLYAPGSWVFIEWPEIIIPLLKEKVCFCKLDYYENQRKISIKNL
jgi:tRNA threonylcarbamoyladenosine biosynthesis protein TsaE